MSEVSVFSVNQGRLNEIQVLPTVPPEGKNRNSTAEILLDPAGRHLYVTNRGTHNIEGVKHGQGSVSVLDFATRKVIATWTIPGGGSPDMGNLSADGKWLWLSGRYDGVIYAFNTDDGSVKTIPVGIHPAWHIFGLTVYYDIVLSTVVAAAIFLWLDET